MALEQGFYHKPDNLIYHLAYPEVPLNSQVVWKFGQDKYSKKIGKLVGFQPSTQRQNELEKIINTREINQEQIIYAAGRTLVLRNNPTTILGVNYNALDIGGFGYFPFKKKDTYTGIIDYESDEILPPTTQNFAESFPTVTQTTVIDQNGEQTILQDEFSFTGAYTNKQAATKIALNLVVLEALANQKNKPFVIPIPLMLGVYPQIKGPNNETACWIVWQVPYQGQRLGVAPFIPGNQIPNYLEKMLRLTPRVGQALRFLHDRLALTHNQATPGNIFIPEIDLPLNLADWSTAYPLAQKKPLISRVSDLYHIINSVTKTIENHGVSAQTNEIIQYLFINTISSYFHDPQFLNYFAKVIQSSQEFSNLLAPKTTEDLYLALRLVMEVANQMGKFPKVTSYNSAFEKTKTVAKELNQLISSNTK